jgi:drug/metabolite transporter (DMT)-like permease
LPSGAATSAPSSVPLVLTLGIVAAVGASLLYNTSIALQALEAREVPGEHSLRPSLIGRLVRNRRWLGATALGLAGWPLEVVALLLAPLTVVQPCLASGLILLLWLGATRLGERPGVREWTAVAAIVAGVAGVALTAPARSTDHAGAGAIALAAILIAIPLLTPYLLRGRSSALGTLAVISAGCGYAWTAIASKLLADELAAGALLLAIGWLATAGLSEGLALLSEMSALQRRPATHVAPVMFAVQVLVPVVVAPLIFDESWSSTPLGGAALIASVAVVVAGTTLLAGSRAVGAVIENAHRGESD